MYDCGAGGLVASTAAAYIRGWGCPIPLVLGLVVGVIAVGR